ncbi:hypothetical protein halTADL_1409 [Halohasta litchfieldiae]|uniref:Uncharacterized protein n=1 Tax=Halohasta litchfieldiae TaxID=1073996 RepID=A0A1H6VYS2_9EURY|nr:hypothetical protein halTADL_1409 [Halohasta litchfieldiae]SEJ09828.1 hypothetical protein SAMN05444271_1217 [Halohasta litchfieldiae]
MWRRYTGSLYDPNFTLQAFLHLLNVTERYYIHTNELGSRDKSKVVQKFVREVLKATDRSPEFIQLVGIKDLLEGYVNQKAVNQLCENTALETTDGVIKGQVKATTENINNAIDLISDPLIELLIYDRNQNLIFARYDTDQNEIHLSESEFEKLQSRLSSQSLRLLEQIPSEP